MSNQQTELPLQGLTDWKDDKPPSEGLWNASRLQSPTAMRWYDINYGWSLTLAMLERNGVTSIAEIQERMRDGDPDLLDFQEGIQYRGLMQPPEGGYPYQFRQTP